MLQAWASRGSRRVLGGVSRLAATSYMRCRFCGTSPHMEGDIDGIGQVDMQLGHRVAVPATNLLRPA